MLLLLSLLFGFAVSYLPSLDITYNVLWPFPRGAREHADPLEAFGGILNIPRGDTTRYPSELANGGNITWTNMTASNGKVELPLNSIHWDLLSSSLGSAVESFQGWALGEFNVTEDGTYFLQCQGANVFVDDYEMRGDTYGSGYWVLPIKLSAGTHHMRVKITRAFFQCNFVNHPTPSDRSQNSSLIYVLQPLAADTVSPGRVVIVPDIVSGSIAGGWFSIPVGNAGDFPSSGGSLSLLSAEINHGAPVNMTLSTVQFPAIYPGQIFPVSGFLQLDSVMSCESSQFVNVSILVSATIGDTVQSTTQNLTLWCKTFPNNTYTFTFQDFDGGVQYAAVTPPLYQCNNFTGFNVSLDKCPIILAAHGAGVDAASHVWTGSFTRQSNAFVLFPTGRRDYGFDWQGPGRANAITTLDYFVSHLPGVPANLKANYSVNGNRVLFTGHSMGGHGCLLLSEMYADRTIGAACASAWLKLWQYSPYYINLATSFSDSHLRGLMDSAFIAYDTDLFAAHLKGIPFVGRTGASDTTVIPWNLRRFLRVLHQETGDLNNEFGHLSEIPNQGHWWSTVLDDSELQAWYNKTLYPAVKNALPANFTVKAVDLWGTGKGGVKILQTHAPSTLASLSFSYDASSNTWVVTSKNVRRFSITHLSDFNTTVVPLPYQTPHLRLDGNAFSFRGQQGKPYYFCSSAPQGGHWSRCDNEKSWKSSERNELTSGPLESVFSTAPIAIVFGTKDGNAEWRKNKAIFLANSLMYQIRTGAIVVADSDASKVPSNYNLILLGGPNVNSYARSVFGKTTMSRADTIEFTGNGFRVGPRSYNEKRNGLISFGAISASPLQLVVLIAGTDIDGETDALAMLPISSEMQSADFVVTGPEFSWKGIGGVLAAGYWGNDWSFRSDLSYPLTDSDESSTAGAGMTSGQIAALVLAPLFALLIGVGFGYYYTNYRIRKGDYQTF